MTDISHLLRKGATVAIDRETTMFLLEGATELQAENSKLREALELCVTEIFYLVNQRTFQKKISELPINSSVRVAYETARETLQTTAEE